MSVPCHKGVFDSKGMVPKSNTCEIALAVRAAPDYMPALFSSVASQQVLPGWDERTNIFRVYLRV